MRSQRSSPKDQTSRVKLFFYEQYPEVARFLEENELYGEVSKYLSNPRALKFVAIWIINFLRTDPRKIADLIKNLGYIPNQDFSCDYDVLFEDYRRDPYNFWPFLYRRFIED